MLHTVVTLYATLGAALQLLFLVVVIHSCSLPVSWLIELFETEIFKDTLICLDSTVYHQNSAL